MKWIKQYIKQYFCNHIWGEEITNKYIDYIGNKVGTRICLKCGKKKKFY